MGKYIINGGKKLYGTVDIQGSKNSAVAILIATLVTDGDTVISNLPDITDVDNCLKILSYYGCAVKRESRVCVKINTDNIRNRTLPCNLIKKIRASNYLIGALLSRFGACELPESGGCNFGSRPVDLHIGAMTALGASVKGGGKFLECRSGLIANNIVFPFKTVGGTVNAIIAAVKARGTTVIENAAREPHIKDLSLFLNSCGAEIYGAGSDRIVIYGKNKLTGSLHTIDYDMIEAGTYMIYGLVTDGKIYCRNAPIGEMQSFFSSLKNYGANITVCNDSVKTEGRHMRGCDVKTAAFPGFPTDLQPLITVLAGISEGHSNITEKIFSNRFGYVRELEKAGLRYNIDGDTLKVSGVTGYSPSIMEATDLRGGAALIGAALNARGRSEILNAEYIQRGYSEIVRKLAGLGADIEFQP